MVKIFLDPGHGGRDPGAVGNGLQEKDLTLKIALKIRDMLVGYEDVRVNLTRTQDVTLSLKQRTDLANAWGADYLISIHINAGGGTGFETFIYPGTGGATVANQNVIHGKIMEQLDVRDRGKKAANLHMVRESRMPAILTENLFIDNKTDAAKLKQDSYIDKIALGHVNGLVAAFGLKKKVSDFFDPVATVAKTMEAARVKRDINVVSDWAKKDWEEARMNGYFDGSRPGAPITREEAAIVVNRLRKNILELIEQNKKNIEDLQI